MVETTVATKHLAPTGQPRIVLPDLEPASTPTPEIVPVSKEVVPVSSEGNSSVEPQPIPQVEAQPPLRRSERVRRPPERFNI